MYQALKSDQRGLEVRAYAGASDDLVDDDADPASVVGKVDVEAEAEGHEEHASPDRREVLTCFLDEDANWRGDEGKREDEGEGIYTGENR